MAAPTTSDYLNSTTPAAPSGKQNIVFQSDGATPEQSISAYDPPMVGDTGSGGTGGNVPAPPTGSAAAGKFLKADGTFAVPGAPAGTATQAGVQQESYTYAADTGAANAYAVSLTPAPTIGAGSVVVFKAANANTGASTLAVNGGSATPIKKEGSVALIAGDIAAGQIVCVVNDGTNFQMFGVPALPIGSSTQAGILQVDGTSITASGGVASATGGAAVKGVYTGNSAHAALSSSGTLSAAFGSNVTKGNSLLIFVYNNAPNVGTITDAQVDSISQIVASTTALDVAVFLALNVAGGSTTLTATTTGAAGIFAVELQNIVGLSAFDADGVGSNSGGTPISTSASVTTANANDYIAAFDLTNLGSGYVTSWSSGFTSRFAAGSIDASGNWVYYADQNVTSAGTVSGTFTASSGGGLTNHYSLFLIALKVGTGVQDFNGRTGHVVLQTSDLPVATTSALGVVKPDGSTITIASGVITAVGTNPGIFPGPLPSSVSTGFTTAVNAGSGLSRTDSAYGQYIVDTTGVGGVRGYVKTYPGSAYTMSLLLSVPPLAVSNDRIGIIICNTLTGQLMQFNLHFTGTAIDYNVLAWSAPGTFNSAPVGNTALFPSSSVMLWLRMKDDGTSIYFSVSTDGNYWKQLYTVTRASSYLGSSGFNYLGFGLNSTSGIGSTILAFSLTTP